MCRQPRFLALSLMLLILGASSAFSQSPSSSDSPPATSLTGPAPETSGPPSSTQAPAQIAPSSPSGELSGISDQLNNTADRLDNLFRALQASLRAAGISQANSDLSLDDSLKLASDSISSMGALKLDLAIANRLAQQASLKSGLWRFGAFSSIAGLAGTALEGRLGQGTAWGAGLGAVAGGVWLAIEHWPFRRL